jgi:hypothetical protein
MQKLSQVRRPLHIMALVVCMIGASPTSARGQEHKPNACGCYQTTAGECICTKRGKCDCPGECEPKGCDEKRQKALEKEVKEETKKAEAAEKKRQEESAAAEKKRQEEAEEKLRKLEEQASAVGESESENDTTSPPKDEAGAKEGKAKAKAKSKGAKPEGKTGDKKPS